VNPDGRSHECSDNNFGPCATSGHWIKVADDVATATVTTNPISVAQRYLSQLTAFVP
jgi:hypothetical protein